MVQGYGLESYGSVQGYGLESYGSVQGLVVGSYEQGNEPAASGTGGGGQRGKKRLFHR